MSEFFYSFVESRTPSQVSKLPPPLPLNPETPPTQRPRPSALFYFSVSLFLGNLRRRPSQQTTPICQVHVSPNVIPMKLHEPHEIKIWHCSSEVDRRDVGDTQELPALRRLVRPAAPCCWLSRGSPSRQVRPAQRLWTPLPRLMPSLVAVAIELTRAEQT